MKGPNSTYFENPFLALNMARPAYKAQAEYSLRAVREAQLGATFTPLLAALETAIAGFDENLTDGGQSTAGGTGAYHAARTAWLTFVGDTMLDYVTPKLRKLPVFADFKKFGKSKLDALDQGALLTRSAALLQLYHEQQAALKYPTLGADALYQALAAAHETRDTQEAALTDARLDLAADRQAIARAQRRLKAQLELAFEEPEKVYSFFDFSAAASARKRAKKAAKAAASAAPAGAGTAA